MSRVPSRPAAAPDVARAMPSANRPKPTKSPSVVASASVNNMPAIAQPVAWTPPPASELLVAGSSASLAPYKPKPSSGAIRDGSGEQAEMAADVTSIIDYTSEDCWKAQFRDNKDRLNKFYANLKTSSIDVRKEWEDDISKMSVKAPAEKSS